MMSVSETVNLSAGLSVDDVDGIRTGSDENLLRVCVKV